MATTLTDVLASTLAVEEPSPLAPEPGELVVGIIAFVLLFLFLRAKVFPVFERTFADRSSAIEGAIAKAEQDRTEAKALLARYERQLAEARDESRTPPCQVTSTATRVAGSSRQSAPNASAGSSHSIDANRSRIADPPSSRTARIAPAGSLLRRRDRIAHHAASAAGKAPPSRRTAPASPRRPPSPARAAAPRRSSRRSAPSRARGGPRTTSPCWW